MNRLVEDETKFTGKVRININKNKMQEQEKKSFLFCNLHKQLVEIILALTRHKEATKKSLPPERISLASGMPGLSETRTQKEFH